jgi:hypothetical protein
MRERYQPQLEIVMRTYFEKPRTVVGWKGLISDPDLNGSYRVNHGLELARRLLLQVNELGSDRHRVSRYGDRAVYCRPDQLGRHRRAHHRKPDPP